MADRRRLNDVTYVPDKFNGGYMVIGIIGHGGTKDYKLIGSTKTISEAKTLHEKYKKNVGKMWSKI